MSKVDKVVGFLPKIMVSYFLVQYFILMMSFQYTISLEPFNAVVFSIVLVYVLLKSKFNKNIFLTLSIYILLMALALIFTAMFAENRMYSVVRILISSWLLFAMLVTFSYVFKQTLQKSSWNNAITKSLIIIMVVAPVGQLLIPEWTYGMRLSGGVNPNTMGYIALFSNFWFFYQKINGNKSKTIKFALFLSMGLIVWSMSRTIFLATGVLYGLYFVGLLLTGIYRIKLKKILLFPILIIVFLAGFNYIQNTQWYLVNIQRIFEVENLVSRSSAWDIALNAFENNVLIGGVGWWNLSEVLSHSSALTDTPHNSYIRILAESGIVGFVAVLALPSFLLIRLFLTFFNKNEKNKRQVIFITSMLTSLMITLAFEDRYLTGYGGLNTGAIAWVMSMGILYLTENIKEKEPSFYIENKKKNFKEPKRYKLTLR